MILAYRPTASAPSAIFGGGNLTKPPILLSPKAQSTPSSSSSSSCISNSRLTSKSPLRCHSSQEQVTTDNPSQVFSVLSSDIPWDKETIWSTFAMYMFNLHIPLGIGGLSIASYVLHQPTLDPQTQAISLLVIQLMELTGALFLLRSTVKPEYDLSSFFIPHKLPAKRNWLLALVLGFGLLTLVVFLTSFIADILIGTKAVNNPILKEILLSSKASKAACILVYCIITPLLEETVYRGFLLTSLASTMNWQRAVFLSSSVFSAAHFSSENFLQLYLIGCVLGYCYCWTGNLSSSILVHSLYNAMTLILTLIS